MRTWLLALALVGCTDTGSTDETDPGTDTDTDTDTADGALAIQIAQDPLVLKPGETINLPFDLLNPPIDVDAEATSDVDGCVETVITGIEQDEPNLRVTGGTAHVGECTLTLEAFGPGDVSASVDLAVQIDVDWGGAVFQWGDREVSGVGDLSVERGELRLAVSARGDEGTYVALERRNFDGTLKDSTRVDDYDDPVMATQGDLSWLAVNDTTEQETSHIIPFSGATAQDAWKVSEQTEYPIAIFASDDSLTLLAYVANGSGQGGVYLQPFGQDGTPGTSVEVFPTADDMTVTRAFPVDGGWRIGGRASGGLFPEVDPNDDWGSVLAKLASDGTLSEIERLGVENTQVLDMKRLPDGKEVISGFLRNVTFDGTQTISGFDGFVRMYNADRSLAWSTIVSTDADERLYTVAVVGDTVIAGGSIDGAGWVVGLDAATGEERWRKTYGTANTRLNRSVRYGQGVVMAGWTRENIAREPQGAFENLMFRIGADGELR